mgnify:CR=1 FL=1
MVALSTLIRTERTRILRRPMTWILAIIVLGLSGMVYFSLGLTLMLPDDESTGLSAEDVANIRELVIFPDGFGFGVTMVERKVAKVLDKFGLEIDAFRQPSHELAAKVLRNELPEAVTSAIGSLRLELNEGYARLIEAASEIDPTLKGPIEKARNAGHVQLSEAEKKIAQHLKMQSDLGLDQLEKARVNLYPNGQPQERVLNVFPYLMRFGVSMLAAVAERMEVVLDATAPAE